MVTQADLALFQKANFRSLALQEFGAVAGKKAPSDALLQ